MEPQQDTFMPEDVPRDAQIIALLLRSMGVKEWEPRVVNQLLEFLYSYVSDVLTDSKDYASHAGRQALDIADVRLAVEARAQKYKQPSRQDLLLSARRRNSTPLPAQPQKIPGVLLPPDELCLIKENYQVVFQSRQDDRR